MKKYNISEYVFFERIEYKVKLMYETVNYGVRGSEHEEVTDFAIIHELDDVTDHLNQRTIDALIDKTVGIYLNDTKEVGTQWR